jgi:hypothetical protein
MRYTNVSRVSTTHGCTRSPMCPDRQSIRGCGLNIWVTSALDKNLQFIHQVDDDRDTFSLHSQIWRHSATLHVQMQRVSKSTFSNSWFWTLPVNSATKLQVHNCSLICTLLTYTSASLDNRTYVYMILLTANDLSRMFLKLRHHVWMTLYISWCHTSSCSTTSLLLTNYCALHRVNFCSDAFRHLLMPSSGSQSTVFFLRHLQSNFISSAEWLYW